MHALRTCFSVAALLALGGCSTTIMLTDQGTAVRQVSAADTPIGCNLLGDVRIGIPPDAARPRTEEEVIILMRNKAGEMGGNHVVVEATDERRVEGEAEASWTGRGIAYACPEGAASPTEIPEDRPAPTSGDDDDGDGDGDGGGETTVETQGF